MGLPPCGLVGVFSKGKVRYEFQTAISRRKKHIWTIEFKKEGLVFQMHLLQNAQKLLKIASYVLIQRTKNLWEYVLRISVLSLIDQY